MKLVIFILVMFISYSATSQVQVPPTWKVTNKTDTLPVELQLTADGKTSIGYNVRVLCITRTLDSVWIHSYYLNDKKKKVTGVWHSKRK